MRLRCIIFTEVVTCPAVCILRVSEQDRVEELRTVEDKLCGVLPGDCLRGAKESLRPTRPVSCAGGMPLTTGEGAQEGVWSEREWARKTTWKTTYLETRQNRGFQRRQSGCCDRHFGHPSSAALLASLFACRSLGSQHCPNWQGRCREQRRAHCTRIPVHNESSWPKRCTVTATVAASLT